ncbi:MAG: head maturation protease, ClpP-related [Dehalococcoidia bacterium]
MATSAQPKPPAKGWYSIRNAGPDEVELFIYSEIGEGGIGAQAFIRDLNAIRASKIALRVNSPGGDVFAAVTIFNALKRHQATITAYVDGLAASAASFLILAASRVLMAPHAQLFIHEAHGLCSGSAKDMSATAAILDRLSDQIASIYAGRAGGDVRDWRKRMKAETWFSDQEAVDAGLADGIAGAAPTARAERKPAPRASQPAPEREAVEPPPAWNPFTYADRWSPRLTETLTAVAMAGERPSEHDMRSLGAELGALWRRPHVLADALGVEVRSVPAGALQRASAPGRQILARTLTPPFFTPAFLVTMTSYEEEERLLAHEIGHWLFPRINDGSGAAEPLCDAFAEAWTAVRTRP